VNIETKRVKLAQVKLNPDNPRRISEKDMARLVKSLTEFPEMMDIREIVVDEGMMVLGGNMRTLALRKAGAKECVAKVVTGLTKEQKRRFVISDNGSWGTWDMDLLSSWDDLPLVDWGVDLPEDWLEGGVPVLDSAGKLSGMSYGDQRGDSVPVNLLGIGGLIERDLMLRVKQHLLDMGAVEDEDSTEQLTAFFLGAIS
jgi:hypothetical protein